MKKATCLSCSVVAVLLASCTTVDVSDAIDLGDGRYSLTAQTTREWTSAKAQALAVARANAFCSSKSAGSRAVIETINGEDAGIRYANAMIVFHCK